MSSITEELKAKADVALDLIAQGADEVEISGTDIKVLRRKKNEAVGSGMTQVVNVNASASAQTVTALAVRLHYIREELEQAHRDDPKIDQLRSKLSSLEKELEKKKPNDKVLKSIVKWSADKGWDVFMKLIPIIIDKLSQGMS